MITKKCALSIGGFAITLLICFITMHVMSLFTLSKWVGVGTGGGIFVIMLIFAVIFRKNKLLPFFILPINAIGDGLALSSLYVYLGAYPAVWETAIVFGGLCILLILYCLMTNIPFFRNHFIISMILYFCIILAALIACAVLIKSKIFPLALMGMIPFTAFFITLATKAENSLVHVRHLSTCSFAALIVIIIVVLIIISQGSGLDGAGGDIGGFGKGARPKRNPYDFYTEL